MLKRTTFIYTCMLVCLLACKKDDSRLPVNYNATFTVDRINYYIGERIDFKTDGVNTTNYQIDYGDGQQSVTTNHIYQAGGVYTVSLLIEGKSVFSKKVRVYPGTTSYELRNGSSFNFKSMRVFTMMSGQLKQESTQEIGNLATGAKTDTVFLTKYLYGPDLKFQADIVTGLGTEMRVGPFFTFHISEIKHNIFTITDAIDVDWYNKLGDYK